MTTGRINQVTIVRRGWPTGAAEGAGEMSSYWWRLREARRAQRLRRVAGCAAGGNPLSPSSFPRASVRRTEPAVGRVAWAPQEEDSARRINHFGVRGAWLPPAALR
jgi:hypothetical protein